MPDHSSTAPHNRITLACAAVCGAPKLVLNYSRYCGIRRYGTSNGLLRSIKTVKNVIADHASTAPYILITCAVRMSLYSFTWIRWNAVRWLHPTTYSRSLEHCVWICHERKLTYCFPAGLGGSAPFAIGGGVIADCWGSEESGQAISLYPRAASRSYHRSSCRCMDCGEIMLAMGKRKANRMKKRLGVADDDQSKIRTPFQSEERHWRRIFVKAMTSPFAMFLSGAHRTVTGAIHGIYIRPHLSHLDDPPNQLSGHLPFSHWNSRATPPISWSWSHSYEPTQCTSRRPHLYVSKLRTKALLNLNFGCGIAILGFGMVLNLQSIQEYIIDAFSMYSASAPQAIHLVHELFGSTPREQSVVHVQGFECSRNLRMLAGVQRLRQVTARHSFGKHRAASTNNHCCQGPSAITATRNGNTSKTQNGSNIDVFFQFGGRFRPRKHSMQAFCVTLLRAKRTGARSPVQSHPANG
ncbi:hypothetical protein BD410DRAFT_808560 [Rickenella mellea]|uniref:Uncharacterized protein n=1 Tax=Rickenella mellea TaxID=50990 RepID=A0A4Y7PMS7_9AGAM|nr:hypothetical protein BD410DRAFT_808560 [Rickenella mellea]